MIKNSLLDFEALLDNSFSSRPILILAVAWFHQRGSRSDEIAPQNQIVHRQLTRMQLQINNGVRILHCQRAIQMICESVASNRSNILPKPS